MEEPKECPFCKGEAIIVEFCHTDGDTWYYPECSNCKCGWQEMYETMEEAIKAWNARRNI